MLHHHLQRLRPTTRRTARRAAARTTSVLGLAIALTAVVPACGSDQDSLAATAAPIVAETAPPGAGQSIQGDVVVFAAASLTAAYTEIGAAFSAEHPGAEVTFNFASSSDLVTQIVEGAPADVFASADTANMAKLTDAGGAAGTPQVFATNSLQIIVPAGNPRGITGLADLAQDGLIYLTCAPEVPIGRYAAQVLDAAGVSVTPASLEENVKGIVAKVTLGEADAGIVYRTDVIAAGTEATGVDIPDDINVVATYPLAITEAAPNATGARAFVDFVLSDDGRAILASHGFGVP